MQSNAHSYADTVFCGDSGNDIEVLASPIPAVLVANSQPQVRELANGLARDGGHADRPVARGNFMGMNGADARRHARGSPITIPPSDGWALLRSTARQKRTYHLFGEVLFDHFPDGKQVLGGAPFNVAWHLRAFWPVHFISRVGADPQGTGIRRAMHDWGAWTSAACRPTPRLPTGPV